jgi:hypothetical protein
MVLKFFYCVFNFQSRKTRTQCFEGNKQEMLKCMLRHIEKFTYRLVKSIWAAPKGYWGLIGKSHLSIWRPCRHCLQSSGDNLRNGHIKADTH